MQSGKGKIIGQKKGVTESGHEVDKGIALSFQWNYPVPSRPSNKSLWNRNIRVDNTGTRNASYI